MNPYFSEEQTGRQQVSTVDLIEARGFSARNIPWCPTPAENTDQFQLMLSGHAVRVSPVKGLSILLGGFPSAEMAYDTPCGPLLAQVEMLGHPLIRAVSPWSPMETLRRLGTIRPGDRRIRLDEMADATIAMWGPNGIGCPSAIAAMAGFHMRHVNGDHRVIDGWTAENWGWPKFTGAAGVGRLPERLWNPKDPESREPVMLIGRLVYFHYEALLRVGLYIGGMRQMEQFGIGLAELMGGERGLLGRVLVGGDDNKTELFVLTANGCPLVVLPNPYEALLAANDRMPMADTMPVERKDDVFDQFPSTVRSVYRLLDRPWRILVSNSPAAKLLANAVARDLVGADPGSHAAFFALRIIPTMGDGLETVVSWFHKYVNDWISRWSRDGG